MFGLGIVSCLKILSLGLDLAVKAGQLHKNFSRERHNVAESSRSSQVQQEGLAPQGKRI